ncbi:MAG: AAA family ATPase [Verrucomicrobiales bacterium]
MLQPSLMDSGLKVLSGFPKSREPAALLQGVIINVCQIFIGKKEVATRAALTLFAGGHVLLEDIPGVGKTLLAKAFARSISADFKRIQFTADLLPSDISGVAIFSAEQQEFLFRQGPVFTQILLADEINRATPRTQSSLLEAMEEGNVTVEGTVHPLPSPFFVIATQNPVELEGTYPLPFAQMDRFMCRLSIGYMNKMAEVEMLKAQRSSDPLERLQPVMSSAEVIALQQAVREVALSNNLAEYIVDIVEATRTHESLEYGASPRGSLDLQALCQAMALSRGRDYVLPDDIKEAARYTLPHRLIIRRGNRSVSFNAQSVIDHIIASATVPL